MLFMARLALKTCRLTLIFLFITKRVFRSSKENRSKRDYALFGGTFSELKVNLVITGNKLSVPFHTLGDKRNPLASQVVSVANLLVTGQ